MERRNNMESILETKDLVKRYRNVCAVNNVSLSIHKGDIFGFVGANGAGKTTFMRMVCGLIRPTSGSMNLFGESSEKGLQEKRKNMGALIEHPAVYTNMSALQNLDIQRRYLEMDFGSNPSKALIDLLGLFFIAHSVYMALRGTYVSSLNRYPSIEYVLCLYSTARMLSIVTILLTAYVIAEDFSMRTVQNVLAAGISRGKYYFSRLCAQMIFIFSLYSAGYGAYIVTRILSTGKVYPDACGGISDCFLCYGIAAAGVCGCYSNDKRLLQKPVRFRGCRGSQAFFLHRSASVQHKGDSRRSRGSGLQRTDSL